MEVRSSQITTMESSRRFTDAAAISYLYRSHWFACLIMEGDQRFSVGDAKVC